MDANAETKKNVISTPPATHSPAVVSSISSVQNLEPMPFTGVKPKKDMRFLWMASITAFGFAALGAALIYVSNIAPLIFAGTTIKASDSKSVILAYPLTISKDTGQSVIQVFLVADDGKPIVNKDVSITASLGSFTPAAAKTSETGSASFTFISDESGIAEINTIADGRPMALQRVTVKVE